MIPGWQTTEFWMTCGATITAFLTALGTTDSNLKITTGIAAGAMVMTYILSRTWLKNNNPPDNNVNRL